MNVANGQPLVLFDGAAQDFGLVPLVAGFPPTFVVGGNPPLGARTNQQRAQTTRVAPFTASAVVGPTDVAMLVQQPSIARGRPRLAMYMPALSEPFKVAPATPADVGMLVQPPSIARGRPRISHLFPSLFEPFPFALTPGYGPGGPVFVVDMEAGSKVTLEWSTDIAKAWDGTEYRAAQLSGPRLTFAATAQLVDGSQRDVRSSIVATAAAGGSFLLGLTYEDVTIVAASPGTVAAVSSVAIDWVLPGQRVLAIGNDGSFVQAVIQGVSGSNLLLDVALGTSCGAAGARIVPLVPIYLSAQQAFARYPIAAETWTIAARAALFGYVGSDVAGVGATLTTFNDPTLGPTPVWDRGLVASADDPAADSVQTLADDLDLGFVPAQFGSAPYPDYGRAVRLISSSVSDWQWLKLFLQTALGPARCWFATTGRADLVQTGVAVGSTIKVLKGVGSGDYTQFWSVGAASRLALLKTDGSVQYVAVTTMVDNGDGTISLGLSAAPTGTISRLSFLDLCRFEDDAMDVVWAASSGDEGWVFTFDAIARAVQQ